MIDDRETNRTGHTLSPLLQAAYVIVLLCAFAIFLVVRFRSIPFANDGNCDPWYIFGLFYRFPDFLQWLHHARQISRLPEILPGYFATLLFPGVIPDYLLFFSYFIAASLIFYRAVRLLIGRNVALFSTIFFAAHPLIIANFSLNLDGPAIVYDVLSLYLIAAAVETTVRSRANLLMFGSGVALGIAANAHLGIAAFAFTNYIIYAVLEVLRPRPLVRTVTSLAAMILLTSLGVIVTTLAFGLVIVAFHGTFVEIFNQILAIPTVEHNGATLFWSADWYTKGPIAGMIVAGGSIAILNIIAYVSAGSDARDTVLMRRILAISIGVLALIAALLGYNEVGGDFVQFDYYYVAFVPYLTLVLFLPIAFADRAGNGNGKLYLGATIFALGAALAVSIDAAMIPWIYIGDDQAVGSLVLAVTAACIFIMLLRAKRAKNNWVLPAYLITTLCMIVLSHPVQLGVQIWLDSRADGAARMDSYIRIREGLSFLEHQKLSTQPDFWIDEASTPGEAIAYPRSYLYCGYPRFPKADPDHPFLHGDDVVVVSGSADIRSRAKAAFGALHLRVSELSEQTIRFNKVAYDILIDHITK